jgi:hypothetical protein
MNSMKFKMAIQPEHTSGMWRIWKARCWPGTMITGPMPSPTTCSSGVIMSTRAITWPGCGSCGLRTWQTPGSKKPAISIPHRARWIYHLAVFGPFTRGSATIRWWPAISTMDSSFSDTGLNDQKATTTPGLIRISHKIIL